MISVSLEIVIRLFFYPILHIEPPATSLYNEVKNCKNTLNKEEGCHPLGWATAFLFPMRLFSNTHIDEKSVFFWCDFSVFLCDKRCDFLCNFCTEYSSFPNKNKNLTNWGQISSNCEINGRGDRT